MKSGPSIKEQIGFDRDLNRRRDLTGSCWKISVMISCGIFDIFLRFF